MGSYKDLIVWQKSMLLTEQVYLICKNLPALEQYGLASQARRSAVSIPSNIAEGSRRRSTKEYQQFLSIATGSSAELETQLILINRLYQIDTALEQLTVIELQKMLSVLQSKLSS